MHAHKETKNPFGIVVEIRDFLKSCLVLGSAISKKLQFAAFKFMALFNVKVNLILKTL